MAWTLADFTLDELARMQRTLRRRLAVDRDPNLVELGFGVAWKRHRLDRRRGLAICMFVCRKRIRPGSAAIARELPVRIRRRRRLRTICLPTDVVEIGRLAPSGPSFSASTVGPAMAGAVTVWQEQTTRGPAHYCGILTVGHAFPSGRRELVLFEGRAGGTDFNGRLYVKSRRPSPVDAAVIHVHPEDLAENAILDADFLTGGLVDPAEMTSVAVLSPAEMVTMPGTRGASLRGDERLPFTFHALLPTMTIPGLGRLRNVVAVRARRPGTFHPGTSGAVWEIGQLPAALQVAAAPPAFRCGFGQALTSDLTWARHALGRRQRFVRGSLQLVAWLRRGV